MRQRLFWASANDDRVTRVGRFIRKTRMDEIPQVLNVLRGDMSFVGPRPERPYFVRQLVQDIPFYAARHSVKPGITGWAQVNGLRGETQTVEQMRARVQYDLSYIDDWSLLLDLKILFLTLFVGFVSRKAY